MASRPWSEQELELIERHAPLSDWRTVLQQLPDRTANAVKVRMTKLRRELGFPDGRGTVDDWAEYQAKSVVASQQLCEATLRVGRWS